MPKDNEIKIYWSDEPMIAKTPRLIEPVNTIELTLRVKDDPVTIPLNKGFTVVDYCDVDLALLRWRCKKGRNTTYAYRREDLGFIHHVILSRMLGRPLISGELVDHVDGDGLNNSRKNLRLATRHQNTQNAKTRKDNKTGYRGVRQHKDRFIAQITANGKQQYLGIYDTAEEAAEAYNKEAEKQHGKFARLNRLP